MADLTDLSGSIGENYSRSQLALVGMNTYSILHDINSNLTALRLNLEQMLDQDHDPDQDYDYLINSKSSLEKIAGLIECTRCQLQKSDFASKFDLLVEIEKVIRLNSLRIKQNHIKVSTSLPGSPVYLRQVRSKFSQVLMNLITNSIEAIQAKEGFTSEPEINIELSLREKMIYLAIKDNGIGMSRAQQANIYEKFESTKSPKSNSGVGMYMVQKIIKEDFGGEIKINSVEGIETEIKLLIPNRDLAED
jgi:signal transduction histidine kinase